MSSTPIRQAYEAIFADSELTDQEKAGYLLAVSRIDPTVKEMSLQEIYILLTATEKEE